MKIQKILFATIILCSAGTLQAACIDSNPNLSLQKILDQWSSCVEKIHKNAIRRANPSLMALAQNAILIKDHVAIAYRKKLKKNVGDIPGGDALLSNLTSFADDITKLSKKRKANYQELNSKLSNYRKSLPIADYDPKLSGYEPSMVSIRGRATTVDVAVDLDLAQVAKIKLKDPDTGKTYSDYKQVNGKTIFTLPADLFVQHGKKSPSKKLTLSVPSRRAKFSLLFGVPMPELGSYKIVYTTGSTRKETKKTQYEIGRFESTLMQVQETTKEICASKGWKIDHKKGHKITIIENYHGEIKKVYPVNDRCVGIDIVARPHGRAFGASRAKKGYVNASINLTEYRSIFTPSKENVVTGNLEWGMKETIKTKAPLVSLNATIKYFDNSSSRLNLSQKNDKRVTIKANQGDTKFTLSAKKR